MLSNSDSQPLGIPSDSEDSGRTPRLSPDDYLDQFPEDEMQNQVDDTKTKAQNSGMCSRSIHST